MHRLAGYAVIVVGLGACTRAQETGTEPAAAPAGQRQSPPAAEPSAASSGGAVSTPYGRVTGGKCEYVDVPGNATVTAIEADETAGPDCKNAKKVTLSFAADDAAAKPHPGDAAFSLSVGGVSFVAAGCVDAYGITVGAKLRTIRHTITSGTCQPLVYEVTTLSSPQDIEKCVAYCGS